MEMEWEILLMSLAGGSGDEAVLMGCCTAFRNKAVLGAVLGKGTLPLGTVIVLGCFTLFHPFLLNSTFEVFSYTHSFSTFIHCYN